MRSLTQHLKKSLLAKSLFYLVAFWVFSVSFVCEHDSKALIVLHDRKITTSEFLHFFQKNCSDSVVQNIDHYLSLFIDMHLKLAQARQEHLDRNITFINDLTNFRIHLAAPYLTDKQKEEELAREAYNRMLFEVNASHILVKINSDDTLNAYKRAIQLRKRIMNGEPLEELANKYSDDPNVKANSGNLGYFSAFQSNYYFEKAVFNMNPGDISMPVLSEKGYHIIKCNDKRKNNKLNKVPPPYEEVESKLIEWIKRPEDTRSKIIRESFTNKLKKEWNFEENKTTSRFLLSIEKKTFYNGFTAPKDIDSLQVLCKIDGKPLNLSNLFNYISDHDTISSRTPVKIDILSYYKKFVSDRLITYENYKLEEKYPEFRYQFWEYRDAMLLLEITKQQVWQKSVSDTLGLIKFYKNNIEKYGNKMNDKHALSDKHIANEISDKVLSDYQSFLMKSWIAELHLKYKVKINQKVWSTVKESLSYEGYYKSSN